MNDPDLILKKRKEGERRCQCGTVLYPMRAEEADMEGGEWEEQIYPSMCTRCLRKFYESRVKSAYGKQLEERDRELAKRYKENIRCYFCNKNKPINENYRQCAPCAIKRNMAILGKGCEADEDTIRRIDKLFRFL